MTPAGRPWAVADRLVPAKTDRPGTPDRDVAAPPGTCRCVVCADPVIRADGGTLRPMKDAPFIPAAFEPPATLSDPRFVLEPLRPQHNERDYAAWTSSSTTSTRRRDPSTARGRGR